MKNKELINKAKRLADSQKELRADKRYHKVLGFFVAKKLLVATNINPQPSIKLDIRDVLWVAENIEPRVLEVLPAAILHFPKTFLHLDQLPKELSDTIESIKKGKKDGQDFQGIAYSKMLHWAKKQLEDGRVKPIGKKKITKTYRFSPKVAESLKALSKKQGKSETSILEDLIRRQQAYT